VKTRDERISKEISIAIVDDRLGTRDLLKKLIYSNLLAKVSLFSSGDDLLREISRGTKFNLYIVDYQLDYGHHAYWGDEVAINILKLHINAIVIGMSSKKDHFRNPEVHFILKGTVTEKLIPLVKKLLQVR